MFTIFFTVIFISELIIASWIISTLKKWDKAVCALNEKIIETRTPIRKSLLNLSLYVNKASVFVAKIKLKLEQQKKNYIYSISKSIIVTVLFLTLDKDGKQVLSTADAIFSLINLTKKIIKIVRR